MVVEKTLQEFLAMPEAHGWVYMVNQDPVVQVHFFIDHNSSTNGKPDKRYTISWRTNNIAISQLREWARELVLMRAWQREEPKYPIRVDTRYVYNSAKTGKYEGKDLYWFLFGNDLDTYDTLTQGIHEKFLNEMGSRIDFVSYEFDFLSTIILVADINSSRRKEIEINLRVPVFPKEFIKTVFEQTTSIAIDPTDCKEIMTSIDVRLTELNKQP